MKLKTFFFGFFLLVSTVGIFYFSSCKHEITYTDFPDIYIDTTINVTSTLYVNEDFCFHNLDIIGGWAYLPSGYRGVFVYQTTPNEFVAFERCCTFDPKIESAKVYYDLKKGVLIDSTCGTEFAIFSGMPKAGSLCERPLKAYKTQYYEYGATKVLRISNN